MVDKTSQPLKFKDKVFNICLSIPEGQVTTYGTVALLAGLPRGARLVGGVLHHAEEELPWHRIVNREGFLSIRCFGHPKSLQKALLEGEGVEVSKDFVVDLNKYGWWG